MISPEYGHSLEQYRTDKIVLQTGVEVLKKFLLANETPTRIGISEPSEKYLLLKKLFEGLIVDGMKEHIDCGEIVYQSIGEGRYIEFSCIEQEDKRGKFYCDFSIYQQTNDPENEDLDTLIAAGYILPESLCESENLPKILAEAEPLLESDDEDDHETDETDPVDTAEVNFGITSKEEYISISYNSDYFPEIWYSLPGYTSGPNDQKHKVYWYFPSTGHIS